MVNAGMEFEIYVFAEIFAGLYVIGRIMEDRLVKALFRKHLTANP